MKFTVHWLMACLLVGLGFCLVGGGQQIASGKAEYAPNHLIVCLKPGWAIPSGPFTRLGRELDDAPQWVKDVLIERADCEIESLTPVTGLMPDRGPAALNDPSDQISARSKDVQALLGRYGLDRMVLIRFDRTIDPYRLAEELMQRYPDIIEFAEPDFIDQPMIEPNDQLFGLQWHLQAPASATEERADVYATEAWEMTTGSPEVVIGVIDAGFDTNHPDLVNKVFVNPGEIPDNDIDDDHNGLVDDVSGWDFIRGDNHPDAETGHGTWMASIAAGETNNLRDTAGVSWGSRVLPLKAGDASGIYVSLQVQALDYAMTLTPYGLRVINMSFGGSSPSLAREAALRAANEAGIVVIAAAGNSGQNIDLVPFYPASFSLTIDNVVAVAASDRLNRTAPFSNVGAETVDVSAPGVGILGLTSRNPSVPGGSENGLVSSNGTSPAAAVVSGITALICSEFPELSPLQVKRRLRGSVDRFATILRDTLAGGRVNAVRSLERDDHAPAPIADLRVVEGPERPTLTWTATGDDGQEGHAALYEIFYLAEPITPSNFDACMRMAGVRFPHPAGVVESQMIPAAVAPGTYYFLVRTYDNVGNAADSNQVAVTVPE